MPAYYSTLLRTGGTHRSIRLKRREREARELTGSVAVGAAGVEDGLRRIDDACGGNLEEKQAAVHALHQVHEDVEDTEPC